MVVAGGEAGKFSVFCPGFGAGLPGMPTYRMSMPYSCIVHPTQFRHTPDTAPEESQPGVGEVVFYDPSGPHGVGESKCKVLTLAPRNSKKTLDGAKVALLDISKGGSSVFLNRVGSLLVRRGATSVRFVKPTFNRPSPASLRNEIRYSGCTHLIAALAD